ncbi:tyrosine-type recombinase/integrase [Thaumasiovibrio sp. DFM-14]|uniref:tyrosine-type recombinase/integrase n=1 Tax=Thaumasiovibrio sp. DFM-14 TaxID=3384792 RepID=UPI0039A23490
MAIADKQLKAIIKQSSIPKAYELSDGMGLNVRVSTKATLTFVYRCRFNGSQKRIVIGKYPTISLKQAREIHKKMLELRELGKNPQIALTGDPDFITADDCVDAWLEQHVVTLSPQSQELYHSIAKNHMYGKLPQIAVERITPREWTQWLDGIAAVNPKTANSVFSKMRACLNFCKTKFLIENTKFDLLRQANVGKAAEKGERVLDFDELAKIWVAIERSKAGTSTKNLHLISMLWGNRLSELRLARRDHFDLDKCLWTVPAEISKTRKQIRRPIPRQIVPFIERLMSIYDDVLFPGADLAVPITISACNRYIRRLRHSLDLPHWRTHDFRRSISTLCSEQGTPPHVIEKMLGHELGGVLGIYNKHNWHEEQLIAYERYADRIMREVQHQLKTR